MSFIRISTLIAIAAAGVIGQVSSHPFTPPIGTDKGSVVPGIRG